MIKLFPHQKYVLFPLLSPPVKNAFLSCKDNLYFSWQTQIIFTSLASSILNFCNTAFLTISANSRISLPAAPP